jgi:hypothetical protein
MSTKIYYGLRFPVGILNNFLVEAYNFEIGLTAERCRKLLDNFSETTRKRIEGEFMVDYARNFPEKYHARVVESMMLDEVFMLLRMNRYDNRIGNPFSLFMGWNLWIWSTPMYTAYYPYVYAYPWGDRVSERYEKMVQLTAPGLPVCEYRYWDNTDHDGYSDEIWKERERMWMQCINHQHLAMVYTSVEFGGYDDFRCTRAIREKIGLDIWTIHKEIDNEKQANTNSLDSLA